MEPPNPARRLTRQESKQQTRGRLLVAARRLFLSRGFNHASLNDIAEEAGFTVGAVYSNFATKGDLLLALFEETVAERATEIESAVAGAAGDADHGISRAAGQWMDRLTADPEWFPLFLELAAHAVRDPELRQRFAVPFGAIRLTIARLVARNAEEHGIELALGPEEIATAVKALANGIALERIVDPDAISDELFGAVLTILLDGVRSDSATEGGER